MADGVENKVADSGRQNGSAHTGAEKVDAMHRLQEELGLIPPRSAQQKISDEIGNDTVYKELNSGHYKKAGQILQDAKECNAINILNPYFNTKAERDFLDFRLQDRSADNRQFTWQSKLNIDQSTGKNLGIEVTISEVQRRTGALGFIGDVMSINGSGSPYAPTYERLKVKITPCDR
jgi:hypothetical protein